MSNIVHFPTPEKRRHMMLDQALVLYNGPGTRQDESEGALAEIMRIALEDPHRGVKVRAARWLKEILNVETFDTQGQPLFLDEEPLLVLTAT